MATTVLAEAARRGVAREKYEFEVLMGVQEGLWDRWRAAGERVRVYVPYGAEWRAYSTRRLKKNPQILGYVLRSFLPG
jgi:proline dehydrogenase